MDLYGKTKEELEAHRQELLAKTEKVNQWVGLAGSKNGAFLIAELERLIQEARKNYIKLRPEHPHIATHLAVNQNTEATYQYLKDQLANAEKEKEELDKEAQDAIKAIKHAAEVDPAPRR